MNGLARFSPLSLSLINVVIKSRRQFGEPEGGSRKAKKPPFSYCAQQLTRKASLRAQYRTTWSYCNYSPFLRRKGTFSASQKKVLANQSRAVLAFRKKEKRNVTCSLWLLRSKRETAAAVRYGQTTFKPDSSQRSLFGCHRINLEISKEKATIKRSLRQKTSNSIIVKPKIWAEGNGSCTKWKTKLEWT